jgi:hypothetical protein
MKKVWIGIGIASGCLLVAVVAVVSKKRAASPDGSRDTPAAVASVRALQELDVAETLYDGKLGSGWDDWGWGPHQLGGGPARIVFEGYGGIILHHGELPWRYGGVAFRYKAPAEYGDFLQVSLRWQGAPDDAFPVVPIEPRHVAVLPEGWREALVEWKELNPAQRAFDRVMISAARAVAGEAVLLDHVVLTKPSGALPAPVGGRDVSLRVMCKGASHPISELIYGAASDEWSSGMSAKRMGGNTYSRFNWELGAWNVGKDWFFENIPQKSVFEQVEEAAKEKHKLVLSVPTLGWVAKDTTSFGFPRSKFPQQGKFDPYRADAGDGMRPDGKPIAPGSPEQTSIPAPPELIGKWVSKLVERDRARGSRGVSMYILDNEPSLWNETHRDVHPEPLGYDELLERSIKYAEAIRAADPDGLIAGPAEWGWLGYMYSGKDREAGVAKQPDRAAHGGVPLVAWYLKKLAEHANSSGKRLLDVLDLHFYPAANNVYGNNAGTDSATSELRLRSTRALWDEGYRDESWINEPIALIPRMKGWVNANYPGLKLAIGEWCFGAENHISGGLATAEALGRFGQHGVDSAFFWGDLKKDNPTYWAFRAFRNFDEKGGRFLDVSMPTQESEKVSLFASRDEGAKRLVLILVNRDATSSVNAKVELQGCGRVTSAKLLSYSGGLNGLSEVRSETSESAVGGVLDSYSISVFAIEVEKPLAL